MGSWMTQFSTRLRKSRWNGWEWESSRKARHSMLTSLCVEYANAKEEKRHSSQKAAAFIWFC
jgi:hypothetical protein